MKYIIVLTLLFCLAMFPCLAEVPPAPTETELSFTLHSSSNNITAGAAFAAPFDRQRFNGYLVVSGQHMHASGETHAANRLAYLEAGIPIRRLEANGFFKVLGNADREIDRQMDYGYFVEAHAIKRRNWSFSAGLGNFARNEIKELEVEAGSTFHWKFFVRAEHQSGFALQYETTSAVDWTDLEYSLTPNFSIEVSDRINIGLTAVIMHADADTHIRSSIATKIRF